jgi:hypothetical protein
MVGQKHSVDKSTPLVILHNRFYSKRIIAQGRSKSEKKKKKKKRKKKKDEKVGNTFQFS